MLEEISAAISHCRLLQFAYKGSVRVVEPHLLGVSKTNNLCLSAFQISGGSGISFRQFHVEEIVSLVVLEEIFLGPRPGFNPFDPSFVQILQSL